PDARGLAAAEFLCSERRSINSVVDICACGLCRLVSIRRFLWPALLRSGHRIDCCSCFVGDASVTSLEPSGDYFEPRDLRYLRFIFGVASCRGPITSFDRSLRSVLMA